MLYAGDYRDAQDAFQGELRGAIQTTQSTWIDSICYHAMLGETYYHMGDYPKALASYSAALKQYSSFSDWMIRVRFPGSIRVDSAAARTRIPWGRSTRSFKIGHFPDTMQIAQGRLNNDDIIRQGGGAVQKPVLFPINVKEIVRCTALALRRRLDLMGPVCKVDPLTTDVLNKLSRRPGPVGWPEAWIDLQLGLAHACAGQTVQAEKLLQRALLAGGEFDHPLTCVAMIELGKLAMKGGDFNAAANLFEEASYSAVYFENAGALEEAFRLGQRAHLLANKRDVYPPLALARNWSRTKRLRQMQTWLSVLLAENFASIGKSKEAQQALEEARGLMGNRDLRNGAVAVQHAFLSAWVAYLRGQPNEASEALSMWIGAQRNGASLWVFQIALADHFYSNGTITPRVAIDLYKEVLRDPQANDWRRDPAEAISALVVPHPISYEYWFDAALKRKEIETALTIADMARRHRFFSTLPLGGRLLTLRAVLESPPEKFAKPVGLQRQDLLVRYPAYAKLSGQAKEIKTQLARRELVPADDAAVREQKAQLNELAALSLQREALLHQMALAREPADLVVPPLQDAKELASRFPTGQAVLIFFETTREMHAFSIHQGQYDHWRIPSKSTLAKGISKMLREMGHFDGNRELALDDLKNHEWHDTAGKLLGYILRDSDFDLSRDIKELVIVPDGVLWYLPFEALPVGSGANAPTLISRMQVRFAPTLSFTVPDEQPRAQTANLGVVVDKLFPRDAETIAEVEFDRLGRSVPAAERLPSPLPAPAHVLRSITDRLVVYDDIEVDPEAPYAWAPISHDRGKTASPLSLWMALPWENPDQVVLPGFHTVAEEALKQRSAGVPPGQEMFLAACGLLSAGSRTVLISRWRTGGQTAFDLVREFVQELPFTTAAASWQRSVELAKDRPLNPELEPRVRSFDGLENITARHPFLWSGYMLIDTGVSPRQDREVAGKEPAFE